MNKIHLKIGKSLSNELVIDDSGIDPHHLELFCDEYHNVFITDLKSINGTFVNDQALDGFKLLVAGDRVRLGGTYIFDWENIILNVNSVKKQVGFVAPVESKEKIKPTPTPTPSSSSSSSSSSTSTTPKPKETTTVNNKNSSKINKELFVIYGLIMLIVLLIYLFF